VSISIYMVYVVEAGQAQSVQIEAVNIWPDV
jgi:hypothetical protein